MTALDLDPIKARHHRVPAPHEVLGTSMARSLDRALLSAADVPALIAEVESLRAQVEATNQQVSGGGQ